MSKNIVCKKCNNLVNDWCEKVIDSPDPDMQRDCQYFCEKTNADRIRSMNDEELAKWIDWLFGRCEWCDTDKMGTDDCNDVSCTPCILEWLKQPEEGE